MLHIAVIIVVSMIDPLLLIGCLIAGITIRKYWLAVLAGVAWRILLQVIVLFTAYQHQSELSMEFFFLSLVGAWIETSIIYFIANKVRLNKASKKDD